MLCYAAEGYATAATASTITEAGLKIAAHSAAQLQSPPAPAYQLTVRFKARSLIATCGSKEVLLHFIFAALL